MKTAPQCARAHVNLGKALIAQGDLKWAVAELKTALPIKPDLPTDFANLGVAYGSMDMHDEAVRSFEKAVAMDPNMSAAH